MNQTSSTSASTNTQKPEATPKDPQLWRDLTAFWLMGLCNLFGFFIMLVAAHDLLHDVETAGDVCSLSIVS